VEVTTLPTGLTAGGDRDPRQASPPAAYFGLQTYLVSRQASGGGQPSVSILLTKQSLHARDVFHRAPKHDERLQLWADLSNSINNVVIENRSGSVWNKVRYFVATPDKTMESAVRGALTRLDIPDSYVFTEQIPSDMTIGLGEESDDFLTVLRYAMPVDGGDDGTRSISGEKTCPWSSCA